MTQVELFTYFTLVTGVGSSFFSARLHYGGTLKYYPITEYVSGKTAMVDWCDPDKWSLCELDSISEALGIDKNSVRYYYVIPGKIVAEWVVCIVKNNDTLTAAAYVAQFGVIDILIAPKQKP